MTLQIPPCRVCAAMLLFAGLSLCVPGARATTVVPPSFSELVAQAQSIVEGRVLAVRCEQSSGQAGHAIIHTYVNIEVSKVLKGPAQATIELRLLGGTVGDRTMQVAGVPRFVPGQRALLFVENNGRQFCPLVGVMHGRYHLVRRASDGAEIVRRDNGAPLRSLADIGRPMDHDEARAAIAEGSADAAGLTMDQFENSIREELDHAANR